MCLINLAIQQNNSIVFCTHYILRKVSYAWEYPANFEMKLSQNPVHIIRTWLVVHWTVTMQVISQSLLILNWQGHFCKAFLCQLNPWSPLCTNAKNINFCLWVLIVIIFHLRTSLKRAFTLQFFVSCSS